VTKEDAPANKDKEGVLPNKNEENGNL